MQSHHHSGRREDGFRPNKKKTITLKESRPKSWSHQDDLTAAIGKKIRLMRAPMPNIEGKVLAADQFTVKVEVQSPSGALSAVVVFKSALTSFEVLA
ncbi:hypothetical protein [Shinella zoogloeoides]|uniref:hypothetical protein n=1 Tax=Shinella zoogloeoides TaxID=352475 RepID=UPI00273E9E99|nr:hypothetical protein [Shinella zoogloeoides]WLR91026.1 hypothetical protein Q9316_00325 [Shinella zoogloeoides]